MEHPKMGKTVSKTAETWEKKHFPLVFARKTLFLLLIDFQYTGAANLTARKQLVRFRRALKEHGQKDTQELTNWGDAFGELKRFITNLPEGKKLIFLD